MALRREKEEVDGFATGFTLLTAARREGNADLMRAAAATGPRREAAHVRIKIGRRAKEERESKLKQNEGERKVNKELKPSI